ncbi:hypothetical protein BaRGS_00012128 [Batillaria attramentaria]|uniref:Cyclase n=1 Tax=Batillaria attramentaria TaxID=370345 RepID=A0ABD0LAY0_9CAEN
MALVSLLVLLSLRLTPILAQFTVVDLTFDLGEFTPVFPGNPPFNFTILFRGKTGGGGWYELNYFGTTEHAGTHVDAPAHYSKGSWRVHEIPASNLVGPAVVIDVSQKATDNPDYQLSVEDVQAWETTYGRIPHGAVVLVNSGRDSLYPDASLVFGTPTPENVSTFHFPGHQSRGRHIPHKETGCHRCGS